MLAKCRAALARRKLLKEQRSLTLPEICTRTQRERCLPCCEPLDSQVDLCRISVCSQAGYFRGLTAPASLKLVGLVSFVFLVLVFPGPHSPGLIEADRMWGMNRTGEYHFRGLTAPASLKPSDHAQSDVAGSPDFRGLTAPASLKPWHACYHISHDDQISGASQPRPH